MISSTEVFSIGAILIFVIFNAKFLYFIMLTIADLLRGDLQFASPPNIYFALKQIVDDPYKSPKDAAFVIENDASLAAKLLKIVNSAFYGFPSQIASIEKAINSDRHPRTTKSGFKHHHYRTLFRFARSNFFHARLLGQKSTLRVTEPRI